MCWDRRLGHLHSCPHSSPQGQEAPASSVHEVPAESSLGLQGPSLMTSENVFSVASSWHSENPRPGTGAA